MGEVTPAIEAQLAAALAAGAKQLVEAGAGEGALMEAQKKARSTALKENLRVAHLASSNSILFVKSYKIKEKLWKRSQQAKAQAAKAAREAYEEQKRLDNLSEYEKKREQRIARNQDFLTQLGFKK